MAGTHRAGLDRIGVLSSRNAGPVRELTVYHSIPIGDSRRIFRSDFEDVA